MHPERAREWTPQRVMAYGLPTLGCDSDEAVALREDQRGSGWKGGPCAPAGSAAVAHCSARSKTPTPPPLDAPTPRTARALGSWQPWPWPHGASGPPR